MPLQRVASRIAGQPPAAGCLDHRVPRQQRKGGAFTFLAKHDVEGARVRVELPQGVRPEPGVQAAVERSQNEKQGCFPVRLR